MDVGAVVELDHAWEVTVEGASALLSDSTVKGWSWYFGSTRLRRMPGASLQLISTPDHRPPATGKSVRRYYLILRSRRTRRTRLSW